MLIPRLRMLRCGEVFVGSSQEWLGRRMCEGHGGWGMMDIMGGPFILGCGFMGSFACKWARYFGVRLC